MWDSVPPKQSDARSHILQHPAWLYLLVTINRFYISGYTYITLMKFLILCVQLSVPPFFVLNMSQTFILVIKLLTKTF